eukprot:4457535-Alexandrium_andersonii.AAC.1
MALGALRVGHAFGTCACAHAQLRAPTAGNRQQGGRSVQAAACRQPCSSMSIAVGSTLSHKKGKASRPQTCGQTDADQWRHTETESNQKRQRETDKDMRQKLTDRQQA